MVLGATKGQPVQLELWRPEYERLSRTVTPESDTEVDVEMVPAAHPVTRHQTRQRVAGAPSQHFDVSTAKTRDATTPLYSDPLDDPRLEHPRWFIDETDHANVARDQRM
jgi:hypothetical protein